jgi:hypothetical protein
LKSLPEWDAEVFEWVTDLDVNEPILSGAKGQSNS